MESGQSLSGAAGVPVMGVDASGNAAFMASAPNAQSGAGGIPSVSRLPSAANTTNSTLVKNAAGRVYAIQGLNAAAAVRYLKLYNKASAPTVGTDVPLKSLPLAASVPFSFTWGDLGMSFPTGIGFGLTVGAADNDTTAVTAGDILQLNIDYA